MKKRIRQPPSPGEKFNRLTFVSVSHKDEKNNIYWECICDCGFRKTIMGTYVRNGKTKSCGCLSSEAGRRTFSNLQKKRREKMTEESVRFVFAKGAFARSNYDDGGLSFDEFLDLSQKNCFYCDAPPSNKFHSAFTSDGKIIKGRENKAYAKFPNATFFYNGLDRLDSRLRHTKENVVPCCVKCNYILSDLPPEAKFLLADGLKKIYQANLLTDWVPHRKRKIDA